MKKNLARPLFIGAVYVGCLTLFILMTATKLGAVKLAQLNGGYGMFDAKFFYSPQKFYEIITMLGAEGRRHYLQTHLLDYAFLTLFAVVQFTLLSFLYTKLDLSAKFSLLFLPIVGQFFADIAENITIDILIRWEYTVQRHGVVRFATSMTILKWIFMLLWLLTVIVLGILFLQKKLKKIKEEA